MPRLFTQHTFPEKEKTMIEYLNAPSACRRRWLQNIVFGGSWLGLRSLASGIPRQVLASPHQFLENTKEQQVQAMLVASQSGQFLVLSGSDDGDPINGNAPGCYDDPAILHSTLPQMAKTQFTLGQNTVTAARVWSTLPAQMRDQCSFFHGRTNHIGHGDFHTVHTLEGSISDRDELASSLGKKLALPLGTLQQAPINISGRDGTESLHFVGTPQPTFSATGLADLLRSPDSLKAYRSSQTLRDRDLSAINALFAAKGTPSQKALLDSWATSQAQARAIGTDVAADLSQITADDPNAQLLCALILFRMKITPVAYVHLPFGGDNHTDGGGEWGPGPLGLETAQHTSSVASLTTFSSQVSRMGLSGKVTFATMNTFGRDNAWELKGRAHNDKHVVNFMVGANVKGSVVGGVKLRQQQLQGQGIDSTSGQPSDTSDIEPTATHLAYAKTLARAVGLDAGTTDELIPSGKVVVSALNI